MCHALPSNAGTEQHPPPTNQPINPKTTSKPYLKGLERRPLLGARRWGAAAAQIDRHAARCHPAARLLRRLGRGRGGEGGGGGGLVADAEGEGRVGVLQGAVCRLLMSRGKFVIM
jgi:hypothetical protein